MDTTGFAAQLERDAYQDVSRTGFPPGHALDEHRHPYDLRGLVTHGQFMIGVGGETVTYGPGDVFELDRDIAHAEHVGPDGVSFLIGRRHSSSAEGAEQSIDSGCPDGADRNIEPGRYIEPFRRDIGS